MSDTSLMLDKLKDQGFYYSTIAGTTVSVYDIQVPQAKYEIFDEADEKLEQIKKFYNKGKLTESERYQNVIKLWTDVKEMCIRDSRRATESTGYEELNAQLTGPNAIAFGHSDAVAPARVLAKFAKDHEALVIKAGMVEGKVLDVEEIKEISKLRCV